MRTLTEQEIKKELTESGWPDDPKHRQWAINAWAWANQCVAAEPLLRESLERERMHLDAEAQGAPVPILKVLKSDGLHCAGCGTLVREDAETCPQCGKDFDGTVIYRPQRQQFSDTGHATDGIRPAGLTPAGWKRLLAMLNHNEAALLRDKNIEVLPDVVLAARLARAGFTGVCKPAEEAGLVLSPTQKLNYCAFEAYCMYALVCRLNIRTRAGRRQRVLAGLKHGLAKCATVAAFGFCDDAHNSVPLAESIMDRLATESERCSGFMMAKAIAGVVLGTDNILLGASLLTRLVPDAAVDSTFTVILSRSFVLESDDLRPEDYAN